jgi:hypothetical protein
MNSVLTVVMVLIFGTIGCVMLFRPSLYMNLKHVRDTYNPKLLGSPWFRINLRSIGFLLCLFILMPATQALAGWTGNAYFSAFSKTLFQVMIVVFFVLWFGYLFDWIAGKLKIIAPSFKERLDQLSPEQDITLQKRETRIAGLALGIVLLLTAAISLARV